MAEQPFMDNADIRLWFKDHYKGECSWVNVISDLPDVRVPKDDPNFGIAVVWLSFHLGNMWSKHGTVRVGPGRRKKMIAAREAGDKPGFLIAMKWTHRIYAVRMRGEVFLGELRIDKMIKDGTAIEIDRCDDAGAEKAIDFIMRDDGERPPRVALRASDAGDEEAQG